MNREEFEELVLGYVEGKFLEARAGDRVTRVAIEKSNLDRIRKIMEAYDALQKPKKSKKKVFSFEKALKHMRKGRKVRYLEWRKDQYIYLKSNGFFDESDKLYYANSEPIIEGQWELYSD